MSFQSAHGQFFGGGGSFGGGFNGIGCGSYVPTVGNECYQPKTGQGVTICVGKACNNSFLRLSNVDITSYIFHFLITIKYV